MTKDFRSGAILKFCGYHTHQINQKKRMNQSENAIAAPPVKHAVFLLAVVLLAYAQTVTFKFLNLDDSAFLIQSEYTHHWQMVPSYFFPAPGDPYLRSVSRIPSFYRPVTST